MPSKSDAHVKATPEPTPSHTLAHHRHQSKDSISTLSAPNTPFINRRPLDAQTEKELRAACALILQNFKPSDHGFHDVDPKLDFHGMNRRREREREHRSGLAPVKVHRPTGAPVDAKSAHDTRKQSHRAEAAVKYHADLPMQANTGRRRVEHTDLLDDEHERRRNTKLSSSEAPRSAMFRSDVDSEDTGTPHTGSTDVHLNNGSTAPTSAALTSGRNSKRASHHFDNPAALADAQAAEWMRQELEKRRQQKPSQPQTQPEEKAAARPPTRSKSIRSGIKDYIFPASAGLSRTQSYESMNTMHSRSSQEPKRSGSSHGWRSWGLQRKSSSRSSSRPGTSKGRIESQELEKKHELNLNRELPPLPSLDSWDKKEQPKKKENRRSQLPGHIATVMRPQDQQQQEYAAAVRRHHRRSGSDTLALHYANSSYAQSAPHVARIGSQAKVQTITAPSRSSKRLDSSMDFDEMMFSMDSSRNLDDQLKFKVEDQSHKRLPSNVSRSGSVKQSSDANRLGAPNFSRKISTDLSSPQNFEHNVPYRNEVQIAPQSEAQKDVNKSKLKKVFSGWMLRKDKKQNWMDQVEKNGIKGGVMIQDEAALPPIVRY